MEDADEGAADRELRRHLNECAACRELFEDGRLRDALETLERGDGESRDALAFDSVREEIDRDGRPLAVLRERSRAVRSSVVGMAVLGVAVFVYSAMLRPEIASYPPLRFWGLGVGFFVFSVGLGTVALRPTYRPSLSAIAVRGCAALVVGYGISVAALPPAHTVAPYYTYGLGAQLIPVAAQCLLLGSIYALPVLAAGWLVLRSTRYLLYPTILLAIAAGTAGHLGLHLHCPLVQPAHLLLGHATVPVVYAAAVGALVYTLDR